MDDSPVPTSSVRSAAEEAILWAAIKDAVGKRYEEARRRALAEMEDAGALKMVVRAAGDRADLGTLNTAGGKWVAEVDEDALLAWVQDHRPGEWYQTAPQLKIRDAFIQALCEDAVRRASLGEEPVAKAVTATEVYPVTVPGVRAVWKPGATTVSANVTAKGRAAEFLENLFRHARGLPAPQPDGETDAPEDEPPGAVGDRPGSPSPQLAELRRRVAHLNGLTRGQPDHPGGAGGAAGRPESVGPVVPGPDRGGDERPDVPAAQLAGGLLGAVASQFARPQSYQHAVTVADLDAYAEPDREPEPVHVTDTDQPAPF